MIGPRGPQDAPRSLREDLQESPKTPKSLIFILRFPVVVAFSRFRAADIPRLPKKPPTSSQEAPQTAQEGRMIGPKGPQQGPRGPEEGLERA
eukprot:3919104-Pyramimonas_sp.AAC.1